MDIFIKSCKHLSSGKVRCYVEGCQDLGGTNFGLVLYITAAHKVVETMLKLLVPTDTHYFGREDAHPKHLQLGTTQVEWVLLILTHFGRILASVRNFLSSSVNGGAAST